MLKIHGPTYRYTGEILHNSALIFVEDHHYDEQEKCHHLKKLIDSNQTIKHTVVFDHVLAHNEDYSAECVFFPVLLARETQEFIQQQICLNWHEKTVAFNFIINKPRPHRNLLLQIIDNLNLTNYCHSLCWQLSPVKSIPITDYRIGNEIVIEQGFKSNTHLNAEIYQHLLQQHVFEPSCISLITEPAYYERETIVTEKTIMAIYGGTIPIWVGGWRIPDYMRSLGFDMFDDIVDHSYQNLSNPEQRCHEAINRNMHLLKKLITVDHRRLENNLKQLTANPWLAQVNNLIKIYPDLRKVWPA